MCLCQVWSPYKCLWATHKHWKHTPHTSQDFKVGIICQRQLTGSEEPLDCEASAESNDHSSANYEVSTKCTVWQRWKQCCCRVYIASLLLKLESVHNVSVRCIDEMVDNLHFIASSAPISAIRDIVVAHFKKNNQTTGNVFVSSLVEELCKSNPRSTALCASGSLSSSFRRQQYYKQKIKVVEPVEYILEPNESVISLFFLLF